MTQQTEQEFKTMIEQAKKLHDDLGIPAGWFCVILVILAFAIYGGVYWW